MKKQMGFSLIELMVVVVIMGVLSTLGGSQYQKFQINEKRSEAKAPLGGVYTAQKAFFSEWNQIGAQAHNNSFQFSADANLDSDTYSDMTMERWTLSENRKLELVTDDIAL